MGPETMHPDIPRFAGVTLSQRYPHLMLPIARIELTQGQHVILDPEDVEFVTLYHWIAQKVEGGRYYAIATILHPDGGFVGAGKSHRRRRTHLYMHKLITGFPLTDHANGNGLDNRRANLRPATQGQNMANRRQSPRGASSYRGVSWHARGRKWRATINVSKKNIHLGNFTDEIAAALAYDAAAVHYQGEFAVTNQMLGLLPPGRESGLPHPDGMVSP